MTRRQTLGAVAAFSLMAQAVSATFVVHRFETPNESTHLAVNLAERGEYGVAVWPELKGPSAIGNPELLRAYQLPAEPWFLALGLLTLPPVAMRYVHVIVTAVLIAAIAAVGLIMGGPRLALGAGLLANVDPFMFAHGPVWDDTFLAAALEWVVFALVAWQLADAANGTARRPVRWLRLVLIAACTALAAMARLQAQLILGLVGLAIVAAPAMRRLRPAGVAILVGLVVSVAGWGVRNLVVLGEFFVGTSRDGLALYRLNYPGAAADILRTGAADRLVQGDFGSEFSDLAALDELAANRRLERDAWAYIRSHPGDVARAAAVKWFASLSGIDFGSAMLSLRNVVVSAANAMLFGLGGLGVLTWSRRAPPQLRRLPLWLAGIAATVTLAMLAVGPVGLRYRVELAGFVYLFAAVALTGSRALSVPEAAAAAAAHHGGRTAPSRRTL